ncbi:Carbonate dehydratase [Alteripontixanthobacter maritimus]|uniref:Carbonic anhydrase n=1 Tax=Alteripontixanthobacter maritimus TaxID=2161824 RepID=A0A369Q8V4_9SPHN|nr:carbonic anhydrase [Alteripontixanthobacter maritimus]RDC59985.1 Carbonate dehydratase [Alteripontixanthobacter maritimus]
MPEFSRLVEGYRRFRTTIYPAQRERFDQLALTGQKPELMVIACSDSRVDPAQVFDVNPGQIFVVRNVAALVPPYETTPGLHGVSAAVEFAVQVLGVKQIVVLGHGRCGGCRAALTGSLDGNAPGEGGFVANWISLLRPAGRAVGDALGTEGREAEQAMEQAAVKISIDNLRSFPFVAEKEAAGSLVLRGAHFAIADGELAVLDNASGIFAPA